MEFARNGSVLGLVLAGLVGGTPAAFGEQIVFVIDPAQSDVDLSVAVGTDSDGVNGFSEADFLNSDTQTYGLAGEVVFDVEVEDGVIVSSQLVSATFRYTGSGRFDDLQFFLAGGIAEVDLVMPPINPVVGNFGEDDKPDPVLSLSHASAGANTGSASIIVHDQAEYAFEGFGQTVEVTDPTGFILVEDFGYNLGPYKQFPDPTDLFTGEFEPNGNLLGFDGEFVSEGIGGAGGIKTSLVHAGSFSALGSLIPFDNKSVDAYLDATEIIAFFNAFADGHDSADLAAPQGLGQEDVDEFLDLVETHNTAP